MYITNGNAEDITLLYVGIFPGYSMPFIYQHSMPQGNHLSDCFFGIIGTAWILWMRGDGKHEMVAQLHQPIWTWEILWVVRTTNQLSPGRKLEMTIYPPEKNTHGNGESTMIFSDFQHYLSCYVFYW